MIPEGYIVSEDFPELTEAEAKAFVIFELKEMVRHLEDVKKIVKDVAEVRRIHNL